MVPPSAAAQRMCHKGTGRPLRPADPSYDEEHAIGSSSGCDTTLYSWKVHLPSNQGLQNLAERACTLTSPALSVPQVLCL